MDNVTKDANAGSGKVTDIFNANVQYKLFRNFIDDLDDICDREYDIKGKSGGTSYDYHVSINVNNKAKVTKQVILADLRDDEKEVTFTLDLTVTVYDRITEDTHKFLYPAVIKLPVYTRQGMKIGGNRYTFTNVLDPAKGWQLEGNGSSDSPFSLVYRPERGSSLKVEYSKAGQIGKYMFKGKTGNCLFTDLLMAITNMPYGELKSTVSCGHPSVDLVVFAKVVDGKIEHKSMRECIENAVKCSLNRNSIVEDDVLDYLFRERYLNNNYLKMTESGRKRFERLCSFKTRALNTVLCEDVAVNDKIYKAGTNLDLDILDEFDKSDLTELHVFSNDERYKILKLPVTDKFDSNALLNMANLLCCELAGLNMVNGIDEYDNKRVSNVYTTFKSYVESSIGRMCDTIENALRNNSVDIPQFGQYNYIDFANPTNTPAQQLVKSLNSISTVANEYKINSSAKVLSIESKDVKGSQFNFADAVVVPESERAGASVNMTSTAFANKDGEMCNAYLPVVDGVVQEDNIVYLTASETYSYKIANDSWDSPDSIVECKMFFKPRKVKARELDYVALSACSASSRFYLSGVFVNHDDSRRGQMEGNQMLQYVPILGCERPDTVTGMLSLYDNNIYRVSDVVERLAILNDVSMSQELCDVGIKLTEIKNVGSVRVLYFKSLDPKLVRGADIKIDLFTNVNEMVSSFNINSIRDNNTWYGNEIICAPLDVVVGGKPLSEFSNLDYRGVPSSEMVEKINEKSVAPGKGLYIGFACDEGYNFEDGIVVCKDVVDSFDFANIFTHRSKHELAKDEVLSPDNAGNSVGADGLARVNTKVKDGSILINYKKKRQGITNNDATSSVTVKSVKVKKGKSGYVLSSEVQGNIATVVVGGIKNLQNGDKLTGLHGDKGVITKIRPRHEMLMDENGVPFDVVFNPLGVPSRMNIGKMFEGAAGVYSKQTGKTVVAAPGGKNDIELIKSLMGDIDVKPLRVIDRKNGRILTNRIYGAYAHIIKLEHQVSSKVASINFAESISERTQQPEKTKTTNAGQSISELVVACLLANGALKTLDFLTAAGSDDIKIKNKMKNDLINYGWTKSFGKNRGFSLLSAYLHMVGFKVSGDTVSGLQYGLLTNKDIEEIGKPLGFGDDLDNILFHDVAHYDTVGSTSRPVASRDNYTYVDTGNIEWVNPSALNNDTAKVYCVFKDGNFKQFGKQDVSKLLDGTYYLGVDSNRGFNVVKLVTASQHKESSLTASGYVTGAKALLKMFKEVTKDDMCKLYTSVIEEIEGKTKPSQEDLERLHKCKNNLERLRTFPELEDLVLNKLLLIPLGLRPYHEDSESIDPVNYIYKKLLQGLQNMNTFRLSNPVKFDNTYTRFYKNLHSYYVDSADSMSVGNMKHMPDLIKDKDVGVIRSSLLRKRTLFSGRSVIRGNPKLRLDCIEVPVKMFYNIYKYKIVNWIKNINPDTDTGNDPELKNVCNALRSLDVKECETLISNLADKRLDSIQVPCSLTESEVKKLYRYVYDLVNEKALKEIVLAVREPALHRQSIEAFVPRLTEELSIGICPLVCTPYNADFDGDQMAIYGIMNEEVYEEILRTMTPKNILFEDRNGDSTYEITQDMVLGLYSATCSDFRTEEEINSGSGYKHVYTSLECLKQDIKLGRLSVSTCVMFVNPYDGQCYVSTGGRIIVNGIIPYGEGFVNGKLKYDCAFDKKVISKTLTAHFRDGREDVQIKFLEDLMDIGFSMANVNNTTISFHDFEEVYDALDISKRKSELLEYHYKLNILERCGLISNTISLYRNKLKELTDSLLSDFKKICGVDTNLGRIFNSGARGSFANLLESLGVVGYVLNINEELQPNPIESSLFEGLTPSETFTSGIKVRRSQLNTTMKTGDAGELTRLLTFAMGDTRIVEDDCGVEPKPVELFYDVTEDSLRQAIDLLIGKSLHFDSLGYEIFNSKPLTYKDITYLCSKHFKQLTREDGEVVNLDYTLKGVSREMITGRYGYRYSDDGSVDTSEEALLTSKDVDVIERLGLDEALVRITFSCNSDYGVCAKCYGLDISLKSLPEIGRTVGETSAQTMGEPTTQLTMDTRHRTADDTSKNTVVGRIKKLLSKSNGDPAIVRSVYSKYKQIITVDEIDNNKVAVDVNQTRYIVEKSRCTVGDRVEVEKGVKVIEGMNNFNDLDDVLYFRHQQYLLWLEYNEIYLSNGVKLNQKHFELLVKSQSDYCLVQSSSNKNVKQNTVYNLFDIEHLVEIGEDIKYRRQFVPLTEMCRSLSVLKGISCRDPIEAISMGVLENRVDKCRSMVGGLLVGKQQHNSDYKVNVSLDRKEAKVKLEPKKTEPVIEVKSPVVKSVAKSSYFADTTDSTDTPFINLGKTAYFK